MSVPSTEQAAPLFGRRWILTSAAHNLGTQFGQMFFGFIQGIILIRCVGAEGKGIVALMTAAVLVPVALLSFGLGTSAQYHLAARKGEPRTIVSLIIVYALIVGGLIAWTVRHFNTPFIALFLGEVKTAGEFVPLASPMALALILNISLSQLLVSADRVRVRNLIQIVETVIGIVGILVLVVGMHMGVHGAVLAATIATFGGAILNGCIAIRRFPFTFRWDGPTVRMLFQYGLRHQGSNVLIFAFKRTECFLLAYFLDVAAVGIYTVAATFVGLLLTVGRSVQEVAMSALVASDQEGRSGEMAGRFSRCLLMFSCIVIVPAAFIGSWAIPRIYGAEFTQAVVPYLVLLLTVIFWGPGPYLTMYVTCIGRPGLGTVATFAVTGFNLLLSFLLIPRIGLVGNAIGTVGGYALNVVLGLYFFRRFSGYPLRSALLITQDDGQTIWRYVKKYWRMALPPAPVQPTSQNGS